MVFNSVVMKQDNVKLREIKPRQELPAIKQSTVNYMSTFMDKNIIDEVVHSYIIRASRVNFT